MSLTLLLPGRSEKLLLIQLLTDIHIIHPTPDISIPELLSLIILREDMAFLMTLNLRSLLQSVVLKVWILQHVPLSIRVMKLSLSSLVSLHTKLLLSLLTEYLSSLRRSLRIIISSCLKISRQQLLIRQSI